MKGKFTIAVGVVGLFTLMANQVWAGPDEEAVIRVIMAEAKAVTEFPKTKDIQSVLKFYAKDYVAIQGGMLQTFQDTEKSLSELEEQINLGSPIGISSRVSNIKVQVSGSLGWAMFDHTFKTGAMGEAVAAVQSKCTGIYKKKGVDWLIQHEHCSSLQPEMGEGEAGQE